MNITRYVLVFLACTFGVSQAAVPLTLTDTKEFKRGAYLTGLGLWNKGSLVEGRDFSANITVQPDSFPDSTAITWRWPDAPPPVSSGAGVYNFSAIDFGNYYGSIVDAPIPCKMLSDIHTLSQSHDVSLDGQLAGYDVVTDLFLTAGPCDHKKHLFEIEILLHTPPNAAATIYRSKLVGRFFSGGVTWTVVVAQGPVPDIFLMPNQMDFLKGEVDVKAIFDYLTAHGVITGKEYFNGLGLGVEVTKGHGSTRINHFSVRYS